MQLQRQVNEKIDWILDVADLEEQVKRARFVAKNDQAFPIFMRMAGIVEEKITGIPDGMPDTYKPDTNIPDGISETTARQELRRIKNFGPNGPMQNISAHKREMSWVQIMEGLHWKEANVMVHIKDQTLFDLYPKLEPVLLKLGVPINLPKKQVKKQKMSKSLQTEVDKAV